MAGWAVVGRAHRPGRARRRLQQRQSAWQCPSPEDTCEGGNAGRRTQLRLFASTLTHTPRCVDAKRSGMPSIARRRPTGPRGQRIIAAPTLFSPSASGVAWWIFSMRWHRLHHRQWHHRPMQPTPSNWGPRRVNGRWRRGPTLLAFSRHAARFCVPLLRGGRVHLAPPDALGGRPPPSTKRSRPQMADLSAGALSR